LQKSTGCYPLVNIVVIALCAVISGADDFVAIARWARIKRDWLAKFLDPDPADQDFNTSHDVTAGRALVVASVAGDGALGTGSFDPQRVVSAEIGALLDPFEVIASPVDPDHDISDAAIHLAFDIGLLAPGESVAKTFALVFGDTQASVEATYASIAAETSA
jgi:hypothetical protein